MPAHEPDLEHSTTPLVLSLAFLQLMCNRVPFAVQDRTPSGNLYEDSIAQQHIINARDLELSGRTTQRASTSVGETELALMIGSILRHLKDRWPPSSLIVGNPVPRRTFLRAS